MLKKILPQAYSFFQITIMNRQVIDLKKLMSSINIFVQLKKKTQSKIRFSNKDYTDYLHGENVNYFFIKRTYIEEFISILSSLSDNKSSGPNSIPTRILKLLKKVISTYLVDIFNLSFPSAIYPTVLKTDIVIPIHRKDSNIQCSN